MLNLTSDSELNDFKTSSKSAYGVIMYTAEWCGPCKGKSTG